MYAMEVSNPRDTEWAYWIAEAQEFGDLQDGDALQSVEMIETDEGTLFVALIQTADGETLTSILADS